jgi:ribose transport system substrate-binding protein
MKRWWMMTICSAILMASCTGLATPAPTLHPQPALLTDRLGTAQDLIPTETEIATAKTALGSKSFIGIVACNSSSEYHATVPKAAQASADKLGLRIEVFDSETKADRQIAAIENFVSKGAQAIAVCAIDPKVVEKAVKEAAAQGVYMLQYAGRDLAVNGISISIEDADLGCAAGQIAGDFVMKEKNGQAVVALLDYPSLPNVVERANQIEACLKQTAPDAKIVGRYLGGTPENGLTSLENALQAHPDIDVVVSINDAGAFGAIKALEAAGKDPQTTIVVGIDADAQAKDLIKQGKFYRGTVDTSPGLTGELVVNAVIKLLSGSTAPKNVRVPVAKITKDSLP